MTDIRFKIEDRDGKFVAEVAGAGVAAIVVKNEGRMGSFNKINFYLFISGVKVAHTTWNGTASEEWYEENIQLWTDRHTPKPRTTKSAKIRVEMGGNWCADFWNILPARNFLHAHGRICADLSVESHDGEWCVVREFSKTERCGHMGRSAKWYRDEIESAITAWKANDQPCPECGQTKKGTE